MLILGFGLAAFSWPRLAVFFVAERVGQMTGATWWEEGLQEPGQRRRWNISRAAPFESQRGGAAQTVEPSGRV
jgi:hypothetical protein